MKKFFHQGVFFTFLLALVSAGAFAGTNITASVTSSSPATKACGTHDGSFTVTASGGDGTGNYFFSIGGAQSASKYSTSPATFSNLLAGNYNITVQDAVSPGFPSVDNSTIAAATYTGGSQSGTYLSINSCNFCYPGTPVGTVWQSFKAGKTGNLTQLSLLFSYGDQPSTVVNGTATLNIYSGAGIGGTLLTTQTVRILGTNPQYWTSFENTYTINTPPSITSGQTYTYSIVPIVNGGINTNHYNVAITYNSVPNTQLNYWTYYGNTFATSGSAMGFETTITTNPAPDNLDKTLSTTLNGTAACTSISISPAPTTTSASNDCNAQNGAITVTATGGDGTNNYYYSATSSNGTPAAYAFGPSPTTISNLKAGSYTVSVQDANSVINSATPSADVATTSSGNNSMYRDPYQAFVAGKTGALTRLDLGFTSNQYSPYNYTGTGTVKIYTGSPTQGNLVQVASQAITVTAPNTYNAAFTQSVQFTSPVFITAGQTYTFAFISSTMPYAYGMQISYDQDASGPFYNVITGLGPNYWQPGNSKLAFTTYVNSINGADSYGATAAVTVNGTSHCTTIVPTVSTANATNGCSSTDGTLTINVTGGDGTGNYAFNVTGPGNTNITRYGPSGTAITGLLAGSYNVVVKDANAAGPQVADVAQSTNDNNMGASFTAGATNNSFYQVYRAYTGGKISVVDIGFGSTITNGKGILNIYSIGGTTNNNYGNPGTLISSQAVTVNGTANFTQRFYLSTLAPVIAGNMYTIEFVPTANFPSSYYFRIGNNAGSTNNLYYDLVVVTNGYPNNQYSNSSQELAFNTFVITSASVQSGDSAVTTATISGTLACTQTSATVTATNKSTNCGPNNGSVTINVTSGGDGTNNYYFSAVNSTNSADAHSLMGPSGSTIPGLGIGTYNITVEDASAFGAPSLDQSQGVAGYQQYENWSSTTPISQSFTAGRTGSFTSFDVGLSFSGITVAGNVKIYQGNGTTGTVLNTTAFNYGVSNSTGLVHITLSSFVPVTSGQQYTISIIPAGTGGSYSLLVGSQYTDSYAGGSAMGGYATGTQDWQFKTYVTGTPIPDASQSTYTKTISYISPCTPVQVSTTVQKANNSCDGQDGSITITATQGDNANNYYYKVTGTNPFTGAAVVRTQTGASPSTIYGLAPATYSVQVFDGGSTDGSDGFASTPVNVTVGSTTTCTNISATVTSTTPSFNPCTHDGSITVNISGGDGTGNYYIYGTSSSGVNNFANYSGHTGSNVFSSLTNDTYSIAIYDYTGSPIYGFTNGDGKNTTISNVVVGLTNPACGGPISFSASPSNTSDPCSANGSITVTITGGGDGSYDFVATPGTHSASGGSGTSITGLPAGNYTITVYNTANHGDGNSATSTSPTTVSYNSGSCSGVSPNASATGLSSCNSNDGTISGYPSGGSGGAYCSGGGSDPYASPACPYYGNLTSASCSNGADPNNGCNSYGNLTPASCSNGADPNNSCNSYGNLNPPSCNNGGDPYNSCVVYGNINGGYCDNGYDFDQGSCQSDGGNWTSTCDNGGDPNNSCASYGSYNSPSCDNGADPNNSCLSSGTLYPASCDNGGDVNNSCVSSGTLNPASCDNGGDPNNSCVAYGSVQYGGSANYNITLYNSSGSQVNSNPNTTYYNFTGLTPDAYSVYVDDGNGHSNTQYITVNGAFCPVQISATATGNNTSNDCNSDGTIVVTAHNGDNSGYYYSLDNSSPQSDYNFYNVSSGSHTITVYDADNGYYAWCCYGSSYDPYSYSFSYSVGSGGSCCPSGYDCDNVCGGTNHGDCNNQCGGTATYDCNNQCGGSATTDCNNQCGGSATTDVCGVCGGPGYDCNYSCGGATYDACGICGGPGYDCANSCNHYVLDCSGSCGGGFTTDVCGVCGGPGYDCNNSCGGATYDACGVCGGPGYDCAYSCNHYVYDCNNQCGGSATTDVCGVCGGPGYDCNNSCGGATYDVCGVCGGPGYDCASSCNHYTTDACGVCNGDGSSCSCLSGYYDCDHICDGGNRGDCYGTCGGTAVYDCNNQCGGSAVYDCNNQCGGSAVYDCNNQCGGSATTDVCGVCGGPGYDCLNTCSGTVTDVCGVCGGPGYDCASSCNGYVLDCNNQCNGGATTDICGVCGGNGSSCTITFSTVGFNPNSSCTAPYNGYYNTEASGGSGNYTYTISPDDNNVGGQSSGYFDRLQGGKNYTVHVVDNNNSSLTADVTSTIANDATGCGGNTWLGNNNDWTDGSNWSSGAAPANCADNVIVNSGTSNDPTISGNASVGNITVNGNVTFTVSGSLSVCGDWMVASGASAVVGAGNVVLTGGNNASQNITGTSTFQTLEVNNAQGAALGSGSHVSIYTMVKLTLGNLDVPSDATLTFKSTSTSQIGILDDFTSGTAGKITGKITAERFYGTAILFGQHMLGSPVSGIKTADLGSNTPSNGAGYLAPTSDCDELHSANGTPYGNVFSSHEAHGSSCTMATWYVEPSTANVNTGQGYSVILTHPNTAFSVMGTTNENSSYTISALGNSNWSNTSLQGRSYLSGWALLSNPYLASLDAEGLVSDNAGSFDLGIMVWNQTTGSYQPATTIAPFQAFMVHRSLPLQGSGNYVINGTHRTTSPATFQKDNNPNELNLVATNTTTGLTDETTVGFNPQATTAFDSKFDFNKLPGDLGRHTLYTLDNGTWMMRNILPSIDQTSTVTVGFEPGVSGTYSFDFNGVSSFDATSYITLEDTKTGTFHDVRSGAYTFTADATKDSWTRFILHFTPAATINTTDATCSSTGLINITQPGKANWDYTLTNTRNTVVSTGTLNQNSSLTASVAAGVYNLTLIDNNGYTVVKSIQVAGAEPVTAMFTPSVTTAEISQEVTLNSTSAAAEYNWNFGDGATASGMNTEHSYTTEGVYNISLTAISSTGCTSTTSHEVTITSRSVTGINNLTNGKITIWSNENRVYIDFTKMNTVDATIEMYNVLGQKLVNDKLTTSTLYTKDITTMEAGYIIVQVKNNDQITTQKVFIGNIK